MFGADFTFSVNVPYGSVVSPKRAPSAPETVVDLIAKAAFWGLQFVWIKGKMHDTYSLPNDHERGYVRL
jgi:hypothetical protein